MEATKIGARFLDSTRGQIVRLLRGGTRTVEELATTLELTDNAVRAHLATLERDGLAVQAGVRRGARKPHFIYALTPEAENLFPKSYDALLNVVLSILKEKLAPDQLKEVLNEVGRKLAGDKAAGRANRPDLHARTQEAVALLEALGGAPRLEAEGNTLRIESTSCPIAVAVETHPEMCGVAEALIAQITGARVRERCNKTENPPRCSFEIVEKRKPTD
jgi:predicted ArsR family transcriptional regulator